MSTREEVEAAASRYEAWINNDMPTPVRTRYERDGHILVDRHIIADAYLADRQQRERDQHTPTREMFERLNISDYCGTLEWDRDHRFPRFYSDGWFVEIPTVARLRAACLLLGIDTEEIL